MYQMYLGTKVFENKLLCVCLVLHMLLKNIELQKLKMVFFHVGNLPSFCFLLFILSFLFQHSFL